jgi:hypothetical protein
MKGGRRRLGCVGRVDHCRMGNNGSGGCWKGKACCVAGDELQGVRRNKGKGCASIFAMYEASTGCAASFCKFTGAGRSLAFHLGERTCCSSRAIAASMSCMAWDAGRRRSKEGAMVVRSIIAKRAPNRSRKVREVCRSTEEWYRCRTRRVGLRRKRSNGYESTVIDAVDHCRRSISCWRLSAVTVLCCTITHWTVAQLRVDLRALENVREGENECFRVTVHDHGVCTYIHPGQVLLQ